MARLALLPQPFGTWVGVFLTTTVLIANSCYLVVVSMVVYSAWFSATTGFNTASIPDYASNDLGNGWLIGSIAVDVGAAVLAALFLIPAMLVFEIDLAHGPGLIFETLPQLFMDMPAGRAVGTYGKTRFWRCCLDVASPNMNPLRRSNFTRIAPASFTAINTRSINPIRFGHPGFF